MCYLGSIPAGAELPTSIRTLDDNLMWYCFQQYLPRLSLWEVKKHAVGSAGNQLLGFRPLPKTNNTSTVTYFTFVIGDVTLIKVKIN